MLTVMSPGRPVVKLEINFTNPLLALDKIEKMCSNPGIQSNIITFATALLTVAGGNESKTCQTETEANSLMGVIYERDSAENFVEAVCDNAENMVNFEKSFLISLLWKQMEERDQVKLMFKFYNDLSLEGQSELMVSSVGFTALSSTATSVGFSVV